MGAPDGPAVAAILRESLTREGRRAVLTVSSGSMEPSLLEGDRVTIERAEPADLRHGDIVVFESPLAGLVVHRVVWFVPPFGGPRAVYTKGDALAYLDSPMAAEAIVGKVVEVEGRRGRRRIGRIEARARWAAAAASWVFRRGLARFGRKALPRQENR